MPKLSESAVGRDNYRGELSCIHVVSFVEKCDTSFRDDNISEPIALSAYCEEHVESMWRRYGDGMETVWRPQRTVWEFTLTAGAWHIGDYGLYSNIDTGIR